jgi:hypothetical protein|eukprot:TRINITY_DN44989_c0_g1_i1.p1 TRINITY_DN44989_c0_g1~~TRINITY_DN44989_c0_g1_i1.p1  ORF type:complete len:292 (-),score=40.90 TRINITY_DN44989_c0_g1_i1:55-930(-)
MARRLDVAHLIVVASVARSLFGVQAVRQDDPEHDFRQSGLVQSNLTRMTIDDCNALLFTIITGTGETEKSDALMLIREKLFPGKGMDVMASFMSDGFFSIEVTQALRTEGMSDRTPSKLTLQKSQRTDIVYQGAFHIDGHTLTWSTKKNGRFDWGSPDARKEKIHMGHEALSGSCFMIIGSAFVAQCLTPENSDAFVKDALVIFENSPVFVGTGTIKTDLQVSDLIMSNSVSDMVTMFVDKCGPRLKTSVGDVISRIPGASVPPPEPEPSLAQTKEELSYGKTMQITLHGV